MNRTDHANTNANTNTNTNKTAPKTHGAKTHGPAAPAVRKTQHAHYVALYERWLPRMRALPATSLRTPSLDVNTAVAQLHGVSDALASVRAQVAELPHFEMTEYDALPEYTQVLEYTHALYLSTVATTDALPGLVEEGDKLREGLLAHGGPLVFEGILKQKQIDELRGAQGYLPLGTALISAGEKILSIWPSLQGHTLLELAKVERAVEVGHSILVAVGKREQGDELVAAATDERQRAFTLAANAYEQARRAVTYLRWNEGDADEIVPSLWAKNSGGRRKKDNETPAQPAPEPAKPASPVRPVSPVDDDLPPIVGNQNPPFAFPVSK